MKTNITRKMFSAAAVLAVTAGGIISGTPAQSQEMKFFRIASGSAGGTYYPMAGLLAQVIANPPGSRTCEKGGNCGMENLVAVAQSANGSVANVNSIRSGQVESGFAQSDVTYWAYTGTGPFEGKEPIKNLCVLASLFQEHAHVVAGINSGVKTVPDFKGKTIGLGLPASGALVGARLIVEAYGLDEKKDFKAEYVKSATAAGMIRDGHADAWITITGYPNSSVVEMASMQGAVMVPVEGAARKSLLDKVKFYSAAKIPGGTYQGNPNDTETVAVSALWVSNSDIDADTHYGVIKGLFDNKQAEKLLANGHAKGKSLTIETAFDGVPIPICPGAERFYKEKGVK